MHGHIRDLPHSTSLAISRQHPDIWSPERPPCRIHLVDLVFDDFTLNQQYHLHPLNMASSFFNPKEYYYITTTKYSGYNLVSESDKTPAFLGEFNKTSSENWQLFFQNGIFFIRNYRWGANLQLGLTPDNKGSPQLYTRSGDLGQQWTLRQVGANFVMMNGLLGASANFSFPDGVGRPGMYSNTGGELWNITINER